MFERQNSDSSPSSASSLERRGDGVGDDCGGGGGGGSVCGWAGRRVVALVMLWEAAK